MGGEASDTAHKHPSWKPAGVVLVAAACGAGIGLLATRWGLDCPKCDRSYDDRAEYAVWSGTVAQQTIAWTTAAALAWRWRVVGAPKAWSRIGIIVVLGVGVGVMLTLPLVTMDYAYDELPHLQQWRMTALGFVGAVATAIVAERLFAAASAAQRLDDDDKETPSTFTELWAFHRRALFVLGTFFTLLMVASAAKAKANDTFPGYNGSFPDTYLFVVAVFYVGALLGLYLPAYTTIRAAGERIASHLAARSTDVGTLTYVEELGRWRTALGVETSARAELERGVVLLAPLISALASTVIGK